MKKNNLPKFLMVFGTLLATACGSTGSSSSILDSSINPSSSVEETDPSYYESQKPVTINSLKEGLVHMNKEKNFTLDVYANKSLYYSIYYSDKYIGADSEGAIYMNMFVNDGKGIFSLNLANDNIVSGEYEVDENEHRLTDLYSSGLYPTFIDVATDWVNEFDGGVEETRISSKMWKINFIQAIGFTQNSYVSLDYINAKYNGEDHTISFDVSFNSGRYLYTCVANNFGSTINKHYRNFMANGGKVYTPSTELAKFRELINMDNFARLTYDFDSQGYISMEYFHEHYFYTKYFTGNTYYGYMAMNHKSTGTDDPDVCGCYFFSVDDTGPHFQSQAFAENPDIPTFMHYPKFLTLLNKLQYMKEATHKDANYSTNLGTRYIVTDEKIIQNFAKNFSLDQTWSLDEVPPYALAIELDLADTDLSKNTIVFHYLMRYNGANYDYPIPLCNFGQSDNPTLDKIYDYYND